VELPISKAELLERLNATEQIPGTASRLRVTEVSIVHESADEPAIELTVEVSTAPGEAERWLFRLPPDAELLEPDVLPQAFAVVVRANLHEWWLMRGQEPALAARGRRLP
jgi:hypothetical protein